MELYEELVVRLERSERECDELREHIKYTQELAANPSLSAAHKWVLFAIREKLGRTARESEQLTEIKVYEIARDIGMSRERTGELIKELAATGALRRLDWYETCRDGKHKTHVRVGLTPLSQTPAAIAMPRPRNHGGQRERCERCGSLNLNIYRAYECQDCHHIHQADMQHPIKQRGKRGPKKRLD